jgi:hypothetical protein
VAFDFGGLARAHQRTTVTGQSLPLQALVRGGGFGTCWASPAPVAAQIPYITATRTRGGKGGDAVAIGAAGLRVGAAEIVKRGIRLHRPMENPTFGGNSSF